MTMTDTQLKAYARELIKEHAGPDFEYLTIHEAAEDSPHVPGGVISDEDARKVSDLIESATVTVSWEDEGASAELPMPRLKALMSETPEWADPTAARDRAIEAALIGADQIIIDYPGASRPVSYAKSVIAALLAHPEVLRALAGVPAPDVAAELDQLDALARTHGYGGRDR